MIPLPIVYSPSRWWAHADNISPSHLPTGERGGRHHRHWPVTQPKYLRLLREHRYPVPSLLRYRSVLKGIVVPRSRHEVPYPTLSSMCYSIFRPHIRKDARSTLRIIPFLLPFHLQLPSQKYEFPQHVAFRWFIFPICSILSIVYRDPVSISFHS
jgi:hypothetical protein